MISIHLDFVRSEVLFFKILFGSHVVCKKHIMDRHKGSNEFKHFVWFSTGIMLVVTGFFNFILSKKKKSDPPKESRSSYRDPALSSVCVTDREDTEHTFSFFHVISGKRASFFPSNSRLHGPTDRAQTVKNTQCKSRQTDTRNVHFIESLRHNDTELEEYNEVEPEDTTSDKAPMIRL